MDIQESWDASTENPKNWPVSRRRIITLVISLFMVVSPISSSIVAPALPIIETEYAISNPFITQMILSIFILASAVGPLVVSPLSEVYGRRLTLNVTMLIFLVFNIACAFAKTTGQLLVFRLMAGIGGSAPAIGPGILGDCWRPEERGRSLRLYYVFTLLGPALGPIAGGFIVEYTDWRWVFYSTSILSATIQGIGFFLVPETYPLALLEKISQDGGTPSTIAAISHKKHQLQVLLPALLRPVKLLGTQVIIQLLAIYTSFLYGLLYLALSTFVTVFTTVYQEAPHIATLNYVALAIGFTFGTQVMAVICDRIYATLKARNNGVGLPEHRAPLLLPGALLVPVGLFLYGWSVQEKLHWAIVDLGAGMLGCGIVLGMQSITSYVVDTYPLYAASSTAALTVPRAIAGFTFPMFAPYMYKTLEYGWGNSLLGFVAIAIAWPAPLVLWKYGAKLRGKSPYATNSM